jgi:S-DNA-T family DNA segregation ATPase FtsK/SpoIIIE
MSRTTIPKQDSVRKTRDPRRAEILREARLLGGAALLLLVLVSLVAYDPAEGSGGLVGKLGQLMARGTFYVFGLTAFLLIPLALFWLGLAFFRKGRARAGERASGLTLVVLGVSAGLALTISSSRYPPLESVGPGGILGLGVRNGLVWALGSIGAFLAVVIFFLVGLALFTDFLVFEMAAEGASALKRLGPWAKRLLWPAPVAAEGAAEGEPGKRRDRTEPDDDPEPPVPAPIAATAPEPESEPAPAAAPLSLKDRLLAARRKRDEDAAAAAEDAEEEPPPVLGSTALPPADEAEGPAAAEEEGKPARKPRAPRKKAPKADPGDYEFPPVDLLDKPRVREVGADEESIQRNAKTLEETLGHFKVEARVVGYTRGPVVTMFELALAAGIKSSKIHALSDDLAIALKAPVRVVAPLPGKSTVGIEVPNAIREDVRLRGLLETDTYRKSEAFIPMLLGVDAGGAHRIEDLTNMPHLLIAGATGSGKSVCINSIIMSVLMTRTPGDVRFILVDPKQVELSFFSRIPHLLSPVVTDMKRALSVLEWAVGQMEERYDLLAMMQVRNIAGYNELGPPGVKKRCEELGDADRDVPTHLPYIVIVVDELADLMMTAGKDIEVLITRLAQKSRAVGIHVVLATQRPSTDVITGLIKANMPTRMAFQVTSKVDSRVVLDQNGSEKLLGKGDMLYLPPRTANLVRAQATFVSDSEVKRVCDFLAERHEPQFNRELTQVCAGALLSEEEKDELYDQAVRIVLEEQRGSASLLQRALEIGYTRSSRLLDLMRREGIVGAYKGSKASEVLVSLEEYEARRAAAAKAAAEKEEDQD